MATSSSRYTRAIARPGVAANNDLKAECSLRGAGFAAGETVAAPRVLAAAAARGWTLRASAGTQYQRPALAALHGLARTGQFTSGLRAGFPVAPSIGLSVQF